MPSRESICASEEFPLLEISVITNQSAMASMNFESIMGQATGCTLHNAEKK